MTVHVATASRNTMLDAIAASFNSGKIRIYDGSQPANANTAISTQVMLVELTYGSTAYAAASGGSATANAITSGVIGTSGTASWCRIFQSDGSTVILDCSVATSGGDITVPTTTFPSGITVNMTSNTISQAA